MRTLKVLIKRDMKLYFKDKGMFFSSLITPAILLVLYVTFLGNVYRSSFASAIPEGFAVAKGLINGCVSGQLISSLLSVSCVTVTFCANMLMVQDKANMSIMDLTNSPVRPSVLALGYYISTFISAFLINMAATGLCLAYVAGQGWYMNVTDILLLIVDEVLIIMIATAFSSIINFFLSTQGQISAVGTIVSSGYGFISGAYMPISQFSTGLQKIISLLPATYGTSLVRNHAMRGVFAEMKNSGFPDAVIDGIRNSVDCNLYFFGEKVSVFAMYIVLGITAAVLIAIYIMMNVIKSKKH